MEINVVKIGRNKFELLFPYNPYVIEKIKGLDKREFNKVNKSWIVDTGNLYALILCFKGSNDFFFRFSEEDRVYFVKNKDAQYAKLLNERKKYDNHKDFINEIIEYKKQLPVLAEKTDFSKYFKNNIVPFKHQKESVLFLSKTGSGLLAAEMGLGKTLIFCLTALVNLKKNKKAIIICPNSLKFSIINDIINFFDESWYILNPQKKKDNIYSLNEAKFIVTNYEFFSKAGNDIKEKLKKHGLTDTSSIQYLICDESHRLKESKTNTYKNIKKCFSSAENVIMSSGTPIKSYSEEIFTQLKFINSLEFNNKTKFLNEYCGLYYDTRSGQYIRKTSEEQMQELNKKLDPYMIRIRKKDALDLPEKFFKYIHIDMSIQEEKEYYEILNGVKEEILGVEIQVNESILISKIAKIREYLSFIKLRHTKEIIDRIIEEGEKVVFIDYFKNTLKYLHDETKGYSVIHTGDETVNQRDSAKKAFMTDVNKSLFIGSSSTCREGLTLTVSSTMFLNTMEWTPAENNQIYDRIHRIGQKNQCNYYIPIVKNSFDEHVFKLLSKKSQTFSKVIDNEDYKDTLLFLLKKHFFNYL